MMKILIADDDPIARKILKAEIERAGHECLAAEDGTEAWDLFREHEFEVVISDWMMPGIDGIELCQRVRHHPKAAYTYFILLTVTGGKSNLVRGIEAGADDYMTKPFDPEELQARLIVAQRITSLHRRSAQAAERIGFLEEQTRVRNAFSGFIGKTQIMQEIYRRLRLAAQSEVTVLLSGQSGTGKEMAAKAIHALSPRKNRSFLGVNCGAIPDTLLESELFGHVKGAFTGADRDKTGLFEAADGGTLLLDEIGEVSTQFQLKLLRVLQEKEIRRVGEDRARKVDVRIVAATNQDLTRMVAAGTFRQDLYYRIRIFEIGLPPLAERREDVPLLVEHFVEEMSRSTHKPLREVSKDALQKLMDYPWPGNVRELRNSIEHAFVVLSGDVLQAEHLPSEVRTYAPAASSPAHPRPESAASPEAERERIEAALRRHGGNRSAAARSLGVSRVTLWKWMRAHGIEVATREVS